MSELTESHRNFLFKLFDRNREGVWLLSSEGVLLDVNKAFCKATGYTREEVLSKSLADWDDQFLGIHLRSELKRLNKGEKIEVTCQFRKPSGVMIPLSILAFVVTDGDQKFYGVYFDPDAEEEMEKVDNRLLLNILSLLNDTVVITNPEGLIEWANASFSRNTGYTLYEALGKKPGDLLKSGVHNKEFYREFWKTISNGEIWEGEMVNTRKDGKQFNEKLRVTPLLDDEGKIEHFVGVKQDLEEKKKMESMLEQVRNFTVMNTLMKGLALDLNNQLSCILLSREMLEGEFSGKEVPQAMVALKQSTDRALSTLNQLLSTGLDSNEEIHDVQLKYVLEDSLESFKKTMQGDPQIMQKFDPEVRSVSGQPSEFKEVFDFLLLQVVEAKATKRTLGVQLSNEWIDGPDAEMSAFLDPGLYVKVAFESEAFDDMVDMLFCEDTALINEAGHKVSQALGALSVRKIIHQYNGAFRVKSKSGEPSLLEIFIPAMLADKGAGTSDDTDVSRVLVEDLIGTGERVLVVDDEENIRNMIKFGLEGLNYKVELASNGQEAIDCLCGGDTEFDLILLDVMMPKMDGGKVLEYLNVLNPRPEVILMSGMKLKESVEKIAETYDALFISKPFTFEQLSKKMIKVLRKAHTSV